MDLGTPDALGSAMHQPMPSHLIQIHTAAVPTYLLVPVDKHNGTFHNFFNELSTASAQLLAVFGCCGNCHIYSTVDLHIQDTPDVHQNFLSSGCRLRSSSCHCSCSGGVHPFNLTVYYILLTIQLTLLASFFCIVSGDSIRFIPSRYLAANFICLL